MGVFIQSMKKKSIPYILLLPSMIFVFGILGYGVIYGIVISLFDYNVYSLDRPFVWIQNYIELFQDRTFLNSLYKSLIFVFCSVFFGILISLVFAIALYKLTIMQGFFKGLTLIPYLISGIAAATMFRFLFSGDVGMVNQLLSVFGIDEILWLADEWLALFVIILANIWFVTPFAILILMAGLQGIDQDIFEAAKIDGASRFRIVYQIIIPLISSMIGVSLIWLSFASFNMFDIILPLTGGGPGRSTEVLAVYLYKLAFNDLNYSLASTVMVVIMALNLMVSYIYLKVFKV